MSTKGKYHATLIHMVLRAVKPRSVSLCQSLSICLSNSHLSPFPSLRGQQVAGWMMDGQRMNQNRIYSSSIHAPKQDRWSWRAFNLSKGWVRKPYHLPGKGLSQRAGDANLQPLMGKALERAGARRTGSKVWAHLNYISGLEILDVQTNYRLDPYIWASHR